MTHLIEVSPNEYEYFNPVIVERDKTTYAVGDKVIVSMIGYRIQKEYIIDVVGGRAMGYVYLHLSPLRDDIPSTVGGGFNNGEGEE